MWAAQTCLKMLSRFWGQCLSLAIFGTTLQQLYAVLLTVPTGFQKIFLPLLLLFGKRVFRPDLPGAGVQLLWLTHLEKIKDTAGDNSRVAPSLSNQGPACLLKEGAKRIFI